MKEVKTMLSSCSKNILFIILTIVLSAGAIFGQTNGFTYQGRLTDGGIPANGNYDLQFALFDAADGTNQIGQTMTVSSVPVSAGVFTLTLDFGANAFSGANRFLEISARPSGAGAFTLLTPRQSITSTPYAVRSLNAATADTSTNAQQLAGVAASQYVKTNDARLSDARDPKAGNSNYVQNSTSQQAANFNISGNGTAGGTLSGNTVNAATQYNLGGQKVLSLSSDNSLSLGSGNVGIGIVSNSKLAVAGTVESTAGGFKFPDLSVQTTAAAKTYTTKGLAELELPNSGYTNILTLTLPPGVYLLTATVHFHNKADFLFQDNTRLVQCQFNDEYLGMFYMGAPGNPMYQFTTTMHTVLTQSATGPVSFRCGDYFFDTGKVFAKSRRLTAVRVADNPVTQ
jgi:hypothetical protein